MDKVRRLGEMKRLWLKSGVFTLSRACWVGKMRRLYMMRKVKNRVWDESSIGVIRVCRMNRESIASVRKKEDKKVAQGS